MQAGPSEKHQVRQPAVVQRTNLPTFLFHSLLNTHELIRSHLPLLLLLLLLPHKKELSFKSLRKHCSFLFGYPARYEKFREMISSPDGEVSNNWFQRHHGGSEKSFFSSYSLVRSEAGSQTLAAAECVPLVPYVNCGLSHVSCLTINDTLNQQKYQHSIYINCLCIS